MIRVKFDFKAGVTSQNIRETVVAIQKKVAFQILTGVVNMTPVLTGRARGNWMVTLQAPGAGYSMDLKDKDGGPTIMAGSAVIDAQSTLGAIYLTNNLPYIVRLENGSSGQAPQGMVQVTLDRVASQFG